MDNLHYDDFLPHVNSHFTVTTDAGATFEQVLISVTENSPSPRQEQFVLVFRAPAEAQPIQNIYQVSHPQLGSGDLFLVPISRDAQGLYFEAVFNRSI